MKIIRRIMLLLLTLCISVPFSACGSATDNELSEMQSETSDGTSETEKSARKIEIDAVVSKEYDRTLPSVNLLEGKSYTSSREADSAYPDKGNVLTDGLAPIGFIPEIWVGYNSMSYEALEITFDLGKEYGGISDFSAYIMQYAPYGIMAPASVTVFVAGENREYTAVGTAYTPSTVGDETVKYSVKLQGTVTARYITFKLEKPKSTWLFVGELEAVAYGEEYISKDSAVYDGREYYGFNGLPEAGEGVDGVGSDSGVIIPSAVYLYANEEIKAEYADEWYNQKSPSLLYDGKNAVSATANDAAWMHFTRGSREIIYDLGGVYSANGFNVGYLKLKNAGIHAPVNFTVSVSTDGNVWQTVYYRTAIGEAGNDIICRVSESFQAVKARFVKFGFNINAHVFADEISVIGYGNSDSTPAPTPENGVDDDKIGYVTAEQFDGVSTVMLSYHAQLTESFGHDEAGLITAEEYLPYVAYLDKDGNIKDTFFDGFIFLPYGVFNRDGFVYTARGWQHFVDDMFYPDRNMNALDECVGTVGNALSKSDYKVSVYTAVLRPWSDKEFGDIDGDGKNEDFSKLEDRKKAVKWIMDAEYSRFNEGNYSHLTFRGFYWFEEEIYYDDPLELETVRYAIDYAHSLGVKMIWIPYNGENGYYDWELLGFDLASFQPNYMFGRTFGSGFVYDVAQKAQNYNACVELEMSVSDSYNNLCRFYEYLRAGVETGYMNSVQIYYQDGVPGVVSDAYNSGNQTLRKLYDDVYLFSKGEYRPVSEEEIILPEYSGKTEVKKGGTLRMTLELGELDEYAAYITVGLSPRYGSLCVNRDGTLVYTPAKGFTGEDTFAVHIELGDAVGELCYITVNVTE